MKKLWVGMRKALSRIFLVDRFLMLFLFVLLFSMVCQLLTGGLVDESDTIDIIIRTSAATIFGYFLSGNSLTTTADQKVSTTPTGSTDPISAAPISQENGPVAVRMGFQASGEDQAQAVGKIALTETPAPSKNACGKLQIWVVAAVGLLSLMALLAAKNYQNITPHFTAVISQLRDFFFASIGFLVSCGKSALQDTK